MLKYDAANKQKHKNHSKWVIRSILSLIVTTIVAYLIIMLTLDSTACQRTVRKSMTQNFFFFVYTQRMHSFNTILITRKLK